MLTTGSFAHYAKLLQESYMTSAIQQSMLHASSEYFIGFNTSTAPRGYHNTSYTTAVPYSFFEYVAEENLGEDSPRTVTIDEVSRTVSNMHGRWLHALYIN